jgi:hypothetical protein
MTEYVRCPRCGRWIPLDINHPYCDSCKREMATAAKVAVAGTAAWFLIPKLIRLLSSTEPARNPPEAITARPTRTPRPRGTAGAACYIAILAPCGHEAKLSGPEALTTQLVHCHRCRENPLQTIRSIRRVI